MLDLIFTKIYSWMGKHRILLLVLLFILTLLSLFRLFTISFKSNIDLMLPKGSHIARDIKFLQTSAFSDKVVISLGLKDKKLPLQKLSSYGTNVIPSQKRGYVRVRTDEVPSSKEQFDKMDLLAREIKAV